MPDLEVKIFNQNLKLSYKENEKKRLIKAVEILNKKWKNFSDLHGRVSDLKIVTLISLELQDSMQDIQILNEKINQSEKNFQLLKKEMNIKDKKLIESLETINKLKAELNINNEEISKTEILIDELHHDLLQIKKNILNK